MHTRYSAALFCAVIAVGMACVGGVKAEPLFPNSVVSNDLDFIRSDDPSVYACFAYLGERTQEMPGHSSNQLMANGVFTYDALFADGTNVEVWVHSDVGSEDNARALVEQVGPRLGKLPTFMRDTLRHVVIHAGDGGAFAEDQGHFFVLYADNMATRIRNNDLEETVFHESVHATLDAQYLRSAAWVSAQRNDADFVTQYAMSRPNKEDMAESALFAYAMIKTPMRLPAGVEDRVRATMPNRLAFFETLFGGDTFTRAGPAPEC